MKRYLNISEVANLMMMSTSQIRFYEKKGLLTPARDETSGYRIYTFQDIERLEAIQLLKDINVPIKEIQHIILKSDDHKYHEIIERSETELMNEIEQLTVRLNMIKRFKENYQTYVNEEISVDYQPERKLAIIGKKVFDTLSEYELYTFITENNLEYLDYDLHITGIETDDNEYLYCIYDEKQRITNLGEGTYTLPDGDYVTYKTKITSFKEILSKFNEFELKCKDLGFKLTGVPVVHDHLESQIYSKDFKYITLQKSILT
jgi:DNA-binding transcriptional MerR regulator